MLQGLAHLTGSGSSYRAWLILQGLDHLKGPGSCYRVWLIVQGLAHLTDFSNGGNIVLNVEILMSLVEDIFHQLFRL